MNPLAISRRHRRPRWFASGAFWGLLVLADVAILSVWAALGTLLLSAFCAGGLALRHRRLLAAGAVPVVTGPSGAPVAPPSAGVAETGSSGISHTEGPRSDQG